VGLVACGGKPEVAGDARHDRALRGLEGDDDERHLPRARFHAQLATDFGPAEAVEPLYLRVPDADRTRA